MMIASMIPAGVAEDEAQSIKITGLDKDDTVQFYKILSWADDTNEAEAKGAVGGWYWEEPFATAFAVNGDHGKAKLQNAVSDVPDYKLMITDTLAGEIARALNNTTSKTPVTVGSPITVASAGGDLKLVVTAEKPFVVKVGGEVVTAGDDTYMISGNTTDSTLYTIDFKPAFLKNLNVATDLTIEYYAKVATTALANINKEKNTVELDYSHIPTTETDGRPGGYKSGRKTSPTTTPSASTLTTWLTGMR